MTPEIYVNGYKLRGVITANLHIDNCLDHQIEVLELEIDGNVEGVWRDTPESGKECNIEARNVFSGIFVALPRSIMETDEGLRLICSYRYVSDVPPLSNAPALSRGITGREPMLGGNKRVEVI